MKRFLFLLTFASFCALLYAGGGSSTYTVNVKATVTPTGSGTVYVGYNTMTQGTFESTSTGTASGVSANTSCKFYCHAKANDGYNFLGWAESTSGSIESSENPYLVTVTATTNSTKNVYAKFAEKVAATVTFEVATNGTYTATDGTNTVTVGSSAQSLTTQETITLTATPASGYKVYGWYTKSGSTKTYFSMFSKTVSQTFTSSTTVGVEFIPADTPVFQIKGSTSEYYTDLNDAIAAAGNTSSVIVLIENGTVPAGNYSIAAKTTLLIPYDDAFTTPTTKPATLASYSALSLYKKLKLAEGANITVNGAICVGGQQTYNGGNTATGSGSGCPTGAYGCLDMSEGGHITLNSGAKLYAWGFIAGQNKDQGNNTSGMGTIDALNGSNVYEDFIMGFWRGGTATSNMNGNSYKVFPFNNYFVPNIEVPLTLHYGATETVFTSVSMSLVGLQEISIKFIASSGGFFKLNSGGSLTKWYDATTDYMCVRTDGSCEVSSLSVSVSGASMNSADYVLPIAPGLDITVASGTLSMGYDLAILPGARLKVASGATANISANMYMYDLDDWDKWAYGYYYCVYRYRPTAHYARTTTSAKTELADAKLDVCGTLNVSGKLYSTTKGANICSSGGGQITFTAAPTATATTYQATQSGTDVSYVSVSCVAAWLQNADGTHVATSGTAANTTYYYYRGVWSTTMPTTLEGDVTGNGVLTDADIDALARILCGFTSGEDEDGNQVDYDLEAADIDGENGVTIADLTKLVNIVHPKP